jgi:hypothetical protein
VLRAADLRWAHLEGANLCGAMLHAARLEGAKLVLANLSWTRFSDSTDLGLAFLHQARLDRSMLTRRHVAGGVGEEHTHLLSARDTYRQLKRHFAASGRAADARWAHVKTRQMDTASHRPDRARRYYGSSVDRRTLPAAELPVGPEQPKPTVARARRPGGEQPLLQRLHRAGEAARFTVRHTAQWILGHGLELTTGYGTSFSRTLGTLTAAWLFFAWLFYQFGAVISLEGGPTGWPEALRYSAAALTPIDAYPLVASAALARPLTMLEGAAGIILLGALGYVSASRICHD